MPSLSAAGCLTLGCRARAVPTGRGRCRPCARVYEQQRGSRQARGYDAEWDALRARHLAAHPWCADGCGLRAMDVDHIETVRTAPHRRLDPTNLRSFAHGCHTRRTAHDSRIVGTHVMGVGGAKISGEIANGGPAGSRAHTREMKIPRLVGAPDA